MRVGRFIYTGYQFRWTQSIGLYKPVDGAYYSIITTINVFKPPNSDVWYTAHLCESYYFGS
jgi:hypothetical protein